MKFIKPVTDFLLRTYLFIASASVCLVLSTYLLLGLKPELTTLTALNFFSTLLIYNFHKISNLFDHPPVSHAFLSAQLRKISGSTKIMIVVSLIGIVASVIFIQVKTLLYFIPLSLITLAYSVPILKVSGKKKRLREILFVKILTLSFVWTFATVLLPLVDGGNDLFTKSSLVLFTERFLFMFAICVPFEIRDMEQEKKWGIQTLPQHIGVKASKASGIIALLMFVLLVYFNYGQSIDVSKHLFALPLYLSAGSAFLLILFSNQHRSKYYFRIFIDGTMQLQFILLLLFKDL